MYVWDIGIKKEYQEDETDTLNVNEYQMVTQWDTKQQLMVKVTLIYHSDYE